MSPESPAPTPETPRPRRAALGIVYFTVFLDLLGFGIVLPFLPFFTEELAGGVDAGLAVGTILTSYSLAQLFGAVFLGRLSDRLGRRPILVSSLAGSAAGMVLSGLATSVAALAAARAVAGLFGGSIAAAQAYIADVTAPHERARYMGILGAAIGLGFVLGPALGAGLHALGLGFSSVAFTAAGLAGVNLVFALFKLPESKNKDLAPPRRRSPGEWLRTLARPNLWPSYAATFFTMLAFVSMETTFALFGERCFGFDERSFGLVLTFVGVIAIVVQGGFIGRLTRRFGVRAVGVAGCVLLGASLVAIPFTCPPRPAEEGHGGPWFVAVMMAMAVLAVGQGFASPALSTLISQAGADDEQGALLGAGRSLGAAARAGGPILAGVLYDVNVASPYLVTGALAVLGGILLLCVGAETSEKPSAV